MDPATFEEFKSKLDKRSNKDLYRMALERGLSLPPGLETKDLILRAMYDALQSPAASTGAQESPSAPSSEVKPPAPVEPGSSVNPPAPAAPVKRLLVLAPSHKSYWRCKRKFSSEWQEFNLSDFTEAELAILKKDRNLHIKHIG